VGDLNNLRLHLHVLCEHEPVHQVHSLRENCLLIDRQASYSWAEYLSHSSDHVQRPLPSSCGVATRVTYKCFERNAEKHEEKCHGLISVSDVLCCFRRILVVVLLELAIKRIKYKVTVLIDESSDCIDELEPCRLVELDDVLGKSGGQWISTLTFSSVSLFRAP